jgi:plasmid stabilization system protein ParE
MIARYSAASRRQLVDIWEFSRRQWGEGHADKYIAALHGAVQQLIAGRKRARRCPEVHPSLGVIACKSHHIYFVLEAEENVLHVVAILHQRMDPKRRIRKALKGE